MSGMNTDLSAALSEHFPSPDHAPTSGPVAGPGDGGADLGAALRDAFPHPDGPGRTGPLSPLLATERVLLELQFNSGTADEAETGWLHGVLSRQPEWVSPTAYTAAVHAMQQNGLIDRAGFLTPLGKGQIRTLYARFGR